MSTSSSASAFENVTAFLGADDRVIHDLLSATRLLVLEARFDAADAAFAELWTRLERHIRLEEEILFPVYVARIGARHGLTIVLGAEHREIRRALALMRGALQAQDAHKFDDGALALSWLLSNHNAIEERVFYPAIDGAMSTEAPLLVERLREGERRRP